MNTPLYSDINTSFAQQQNPLRSIELPCDKEYTQVNLGSCAYFLLLDYPADVRVYISLNPERKDAFLVDNRNTGFKINDVYTQQGIPSFTKNVYLWTEGITNLRDYNGGSAKVRIATSGVYSFEILNNSSINAIAQIAEVGRVNSIGGYPATAITKIINGSTALTSDETLIIDASLINDTLFYNVSGLVNVDVGSDVSETASLNISIELLGNGVIDNNNIQICNYTLKQSATSKLWGSNSPSSLQLKGSDLNSFYTFNDEDDKSLFFGKKVIKIKPSLTLSSGFNPKYTIQIAFYEA